MQHDRPRTTVDQWVRMTPEEQRADLERRIIRDPAELPPEFRAQVEADDADLARRLHRLDDE